ncbi:FAD-dependent oxidoreductase [Kluyvera ascorbata]|uniref:FAD-dependent oxidoreductase n=1 Tax=Kluyvera ascorbata TaxID=51288 RepID=UPI0004E3CC46|nr:FAD-dependent oxidoreductase [Kluyvera ascorbata]EJG2386964.1 FAD-dependent oxidoreductase [Kluyvera ascorbata]KFD03716.1 succinate dehydrogenase/fumarate reductase, flavoprotein subunit [Kluyvera ascorbata ATCC 33433]STW99698.1 3-oxosteroid 1-dehydrogenase [Kluyvera ascorbata]BCA40921.1 FAD-binding dehydrogenase [Kluyvera ascorbata]HBL0730995.1 FAD-dependent oxidoreductase [Kluyvera ascorbata]
MSRHVEVDMLVIGSGAAGLSAAVTAALHGARVLVAEKESTIGGTSAWSGGWLWIPQNPLAREEGIMEDDAAPLRYLQSEMEGRPADARLRTFLRYGPEMVDFFRKNTAVQFLSGSKMPDFHNSPGYATGGRSVTAKPYDARGLGDWLHRLRPPLETISLAGMGIAGGADMAHFFNATRSPRSALYAARRLMRHGWQRLCYGRGRHLVNGNALVARLLRSALDANVNFQLNAPVTRLLQDNRGVTGAILNSDDGEIQVNARAVVLACGGFPHDKQRLAGQVPHAAQGYGHFSAAPPGNQGDGIRLGETAGGQFDSSLKHPMAWAPVSRVSLASGLQLAFPHLVERAKPGFIAVRSNGKRFVNEADSYHDFIAALLDATPEGEKPVAWLIADSRALHRYGLGHARPTPFPVKAWLRTGYLQSADTLEALAQKCGIDASTLSDTVNRFNGFARQAHDDDFQRGASAYNCAQGDASHQPNPTLGELQQAPYFAVRILPGSLGSFSGLKTDERARVLDAEQHPIPGLFAVGNDMSSVMQGFYPSGGITLGPAMTFGYLVGKNLSANITS